MIVLYDNIDICPIWNWDKVHETGNTFYLEKRDNYKKLPEDKKGKNYALWLDLYDQYIQEFGLNINFKDVLRIQREIGLLRADLIIHKELTNKTFIRVLERELKILMPEDGVKLTETVVVLEKHFGFSMDAKTTTVLKHFSYLRELENHNQQVREWQRSQTTR